MVTDQHGEHGGHHLADHSPVSDSRTPCFHRLVTDPADNERYLSSV
jgi:hypothetical protein